MHAQRLLDDSVLALAFEKVERDLTATITRSAVGEVEQREGAYRMIWALKEVRQKLVILAGDGKLLAAEQERREAEAERERERRERAA